MGRKRDLPRSTCPISLALEVIGDPWTLLVMRDALYLGKRRFGEFLSSPEKIATNILADRLDRLVRNGVLRRGPAEHGREGPTYAPTEKGLDLIPVMVEMVLWSERYEPLSAPPPGLIRRIRADREESIELVKKRVRAGRPGLG